VKRSIGVAPRFVGFFIAISGLILLITGVYVYSAGMLAVRAGSVAAVVSAAAYPVALAALFGSAVFVLMRLALSRVSPIIGLLVLWVLFLLVLFFVLPLVRETTSWNGEEPAVEAEVPVFPLQTVLRAGDTAIILDVQTGLRLDGVIGIQFAAVPRIARYEHLYFDPDENHFVAADGTILPLGTARFSDQQSVRIPEPAAKTIDDLLRAGHRIVSLGVPWRGMTVAGYAELLSLSVLLLSIWTFARMSQWFLLNAALTLLAARAILWLYSPPLIEFVRAQLPPGLSEYAAAIGIAIAAILLLVIAILLPPLHTLDVDYES